MIFIPVRKAPQSRVEKQLAFLIKRQNQFKQAALEAKKRGEIEQAKEYLRMSKGFNQLIDASRGGLPIDMNTVSVSLLGLVSYFYPIFFLFVFLIISIFVSPFCSFSSIF